MCKRALDDSAAAGTGVHSLMIGERGLKMFFVRLIRYLKSFNGCNQRLPLLQANHTYEMHMIMMTMYTYVCRCK